MRKIKIIPFFLILLVLFGLFSSLSAFAIEDPTLISRSAMVLSADTGEVFYTKNPDEKIYPASTTKIMTVLLAVEAIERGDVKAEDVVTASNNIGFDLISDGSTAGISPGEAMTFESVLYCAMVSSANEACNIIAEYISGSVSEFVELMNSRAISLGCSYTHFANTHGLPNDNHYTTCRDFSKIAMEASKHELFMKICSTATIEIPKTNKSPARVLNNSNALICTDSIYGNKYYYDKAAGMKTGFTSSAGYCLVSTAADNGTGINLIALVFGGSMSQASDGYSYSNFSDSITLYDWVFNNYSYREILSSAKNVASLEVKMSDDADYVNLRPDTSITVLLPNDFSDADIEQKITAYNTEILEAPITAGEVLGEISLYGGGELLGTSKLVAAASLSLSREMYMKARIHDTLASKPVKRTIIILAVLLFLYLALVVVYRVRRIRYRLAIRAAEKEERAALRQSSAQIERNIETDIAKEEQRRAARRSVSEEEVKGLRDIDFFNEEIEDEQGPEPENNEELPAMPARPVDTSGANAPRQTPPGFFEASGDPVSPEEKDYFEEFFRKK